MADQAKVDNTEAKEDGLEVAAERVFPCNYCDKVFYCSQALGGHRNAHRMERFPFKRPQVPQYDPFDPYINIPPPPQFISHFAPVQFHCQPPMHRPYYRHGYALIPRPGYAPQAAHLRQTLYSPSHYGNRYQPYNFSPNRIFRPNGPAYSVFNYNPRFFENSSYQSHVQAVEPPSLNWLFNRSNNEQGSSSGQDGQGNEDQRDDKENDEKEGLDLTLRL